MLGEVTDHPEQPVDLVLVEHRRRFVHHDELDVVGECPSHAHDLLAGGRELANLAARRYLWVPQPGQQGFRSALGVAATGQSQGAHLVSEVDVLGHGQAIDKIQFLVDRGDSEPHCRDRIGQPDVVALPGDRSLVGVMHPGQNLDQGRLAGAVLAEQAMHLAGHDIEVDPVESADTGELLDDRVHLQQRLGHGIPPTAPDPVNDTAQRCNNNADLVVGGVIPHLESSVQREEIERSLSATAASTEDGRRPPRPRSRGWTAVSMGMAAPPHVMVHAVAERRPSFDQMTRALDEAESQT